MSTGAECYFLERNPSEWYYHIQRWPYGEWEEYDKNGPFFTYDEALEHMDQNYPNPGGWSTHIHKNHVHHFTIDEHDFTKMVCAADNYQP